MPTVWRIRLTPAGSRVSIPRTRTVPRWGRSSAFRWRARVDFPEPLGPMIARCSPRWTASESPRRTRGSGVRGEGALYENSTALQTISGSGIRRCGLRPCAAGERVAGRRGIDAARLDEVGHPDELVDLVGNRHIPRSDRHDGDPRPGRQKGSVRRSGHAPAPRGPSLDAAAGPLDRAGDRRVRGRLRPRPLLDHFDGALTAWDAGGGRRRRGREVVSDLRGLLPRDGPDIERDQGIGVDDIQLRRIAGPEHRGRHAGLAQQRVPSVAPAVAFLEGLDPPDERRGGGDG